MAGSCARTEDGGGRVPHSTLQPRYRGMGARVGVCSGESRQADVEVWDELEEGLAPAPAAPASDPAPGPSHAAPGLYCRGPCGEERCCCDSAGRSSCSVCGCGSVDCVSGADSAGSSTWGLEELQLDRCLGATAASVVSSSGAPLSSQMR